MKWIALALLAALALSPQKARSQTYTGVVTHVVDGDTIVVGERRVRIADIDTPEKVFCKTGQTRCALCSWEAELGRQASAYVHQLLHLRTVTVRVRKIDRYNRDFAYVDLGGMDVGKHLVEKGYAKPWPDRQPKPEWCR